MKNGLKSLFLAFSLWAFYAELTNNREVICAMQFVLMPVLMIYYFVGVNGKWNKMHKLLFAALFFSWIGADFLAFAPRNSGDLAVFGIAKNKNYFLGGIAGYFLAHIFFIWSYFESKTENIPSLFSRKKALFLPILLYGLLMVYIIVPRVYANPEKSIAAIPMVFYAVILCSMLAFALNRFGRVNSQSFWLVFLGSVLFILSDSMIAIHFVAFEGAIPQGGFWIMLTYYAAVFMIADGILKSGKQ